MSVRRRRGQLNHHKGLMAEDQAADAYLRNGFAIADRRYRTCDGELDIVAHHGDTYYFVEVKSSKTHADAAQQITPRQQKRLYRAALRYLADRVGSIDVNCRFDAALVDAMGRLKVIPNALVFG